LLLQNPRMSVLELCLASGGDGKKMRGMQMDGGEERWSVYDFINVVCGKPENNGYARATFGNLIADTSEYKDEVAKNLCNLKFPGRGQRETPCLLWPLCDSVTLPCPPPSCHHHHCHYRFRAATPPPRSPRRIFRRRPSRHCRGQQPGLPRRVARSRPWRRWRHHGRRAATAPHPRPHRLAPPDRASERGPAGRVGVGGRRGPARTRCRW
jgi:hypothetical protein